MTINVGKVNFVLVSQYSHFFSFSAEPCLEVGRCSTFFLTGSSIVSTHRGTTSGGGGMKSSSYVSNIDVLRA